MVDLKVARQEKIARRRPRIGSATGANTVEKTGVLGLGFIPNRHERRK
jgi:hypothetical protein